MNKDKTMVRLASLLIVLAFTSVAVAQEGAPSATPAAEPATGAKPAEPAAPPAKIDGKYRYVGGDKELKTVEEAIEKAVQEMLFIKRPIARSRLKSRSKTPTAWIFVTAGGQLKTTAEGIMTWQSPVDGSPADTKTSQGDDAKLTQKWAGTKLVQLFVTEDGSRENDFTLADDGVTLTCKTTFRSGQLAQPLVYTQTFKK